MKSIAKWIMVMIMDYREGRSVFGERVINWRMSMDCYSRNHSTLQIHTTSRMVSTSVPQTFRSLFSLLRSFLLNPDSPGLPSSYTRQDDALFETTRRLLAEIVNEGLVEATVATALDKNKQPIQYLYLHPRQDFSVADDARWVRVSVRPGTSVEVRDGRVAAVVRPDCLEMPVVIGTKEDSKGGEELDPGVLFRFVSPWMAGDAGPDVLDGIALELQNSARNQDKWLEISAGQKLLALTDSSVEWEQSLIYGHPSHPFHRLCYAQPPLAPVEPEDIPEMRTPALAFLSVPREDMRVTGSFESLIQPLLENLDIPATSSDRIIVPCLSRQLPAVVQRFPRAVHLKTVTDCADAQASMRTLTLRPHCRFPFHLKLSLACQITSALRTITPWTTCGGPVQTSLLEKFLPEDMWVFREVAAVSGGQENFSDARHLSCILREDLEARADQNNETLVIAAALAQKPHGSDQTYVETLYGLETIEQKREWFQRYVSRLFSLVLPPLVRYGIGLEAHGQNLVARINRHSGEITGFAVRDFGGVRMHVPTLRKHGVSFASLPPGGATLTDDLHNVWSKVNHALVQNHIGLILSALGLETKAGRGWSIVRDALQDVLENEGENGKKVLENFMQDTMPFKCFLRMRMEGKYRDYVEREVPNVLLMDSSRWETVIKTHEPLLHYT